jgi:hypothetical protein
MQALVLLALKKLARIARDAASQPGNARRSRGRAHPITAKRMGKLQKIAGH